MLRGSFGVCCSRLGRDDELASPQVTDYQLPDTTFGGRSAGTSSLTAKLVRTIAQRFLRHALSIAGEYRINGFSVRSASQAGPGLWLTATWPLLCERHERG